MADPYNYYLVDRAGITHTILSEAENLADEINEDINALQKFADERHFQLALAQHTANYVLIGAEMMPQDPVVLPVFRAGKESVIRDDLAPLSDYLTANSISNRNLYYAVCRGNPGICCDRKSLMENLQKLNDYKNIEEKIVGAAKDAKIEVTTPAETACVVRGSNIKLHARAYNTAPNWIYKCPVSETTDKSFVPPQSTLMTKDELKAKIGETSLTEWKCEHRRIWDRLDQLEKVEMPALHSPRRSARTSLVSNLLTRMGLTR